eukprot:gnl/MRDRNA2_/MRDRNA2_123334_c0_seq1.p1 gnl/MRDRNA2_/MRDRNA2_123334_c0~~gnl/MRDRNA2_/MRDRNA2_123334_c0_seq1.p1  ORF type:complete len:713 (-),score=108.58 gnl/MRDRNA2_/MRDRNA2_123334_c0_seq1:129-2267(-)
MQKQFYLIASVMCFVSCKRMHLIMEDTSDRVGEEGFRTEDESVDYEWGGKLQVDGNEWGDEAEPSAATDTVPTEDSLGTGEEGQHCHECAQGDMIILQHLQDEDEHGNASSSRSTSRGILGFGKSEGNAKQWPKGVVKYYWDPYIHPNAKSAAEMAMAEWMAKTCIKFQQYTSGGSGIVTFKSSLAGCQAHVGYYRSIPSHMNLGTGCHDKGTALHEIGHTIGLSHEHSRHDRNEYVDVFTSHVQPGNVQWFGADGALEKDVPYDLSSIMHYGMFAFAHQRVKGHETMLPKKKDHWGNCQIGQRSWVSKGDMMTVNRWYKCSDQYCKKLDSVECSKRDTTCKDTSWDCASGSQHSYTSGTINCLDLNFQRGCPRTCGACPADVFCPSSKPKPQVNAPKPQSGHGFGAGFGGFEGFFPGPSHGFGGFGGSHGFGPSHGHGSVPYHHKPHGFGPVVQLPPPQGLTSGKPVKPPPKKVTVIPTGCQCMNSAPPGVQVGRVCGKELIGGGRAAKKWCYVDASTSTCPDKRKSGTDGFMWSELACKHPKKPAGRPVKPPPKTSLPTPSPRCQCMNQAPEGVNVGIKCGKELISGDYAEADWCYIDASSVACPDMQQSSFSGFAWSELACKQPPPKQQEESLPGLDGDGSPDCKCAGRVPPSESIGITCTNYLRTGARVDTQWCYVEVSSGCMDKRKSGLAEDLYWSEDACGEIPRSS